MSIGFDWVDNSNDSFTVFAMNMISEDHNQLKTEINSGISQNGDIKDVQIDLEGNADHHIYFCYHTATSGYKTVLEIIIIDADYSVGDPGNFIPTDIGGPSPAGGSGPGPFIPLVINNPTIHATIYPNPTRGNINIEFDAPTDEIVEFEIFDHFGKAISSASQTMEATKGRNKLSMDLDLPAGLYIVNMKGNSNSYQPQKILIQ